MELNGDEKLLRKSRGNHRANHLNPFGWAGGTWFLTNYRLIFESNALNTQTRKESIRLENIISIEAKHRDFISSKLSIFLNNGSALELHVPQRRHWINDIGKAIKELRGDSEPDWDVYNIINTKTVKKPPGVIIKTVLMVLLLALFVSAVTFLLLSLLAQH
jgi:hypothetical protein